MIENYRLSLHPHVFIQQKHGEVILHTQHLNLVFDCTVYPFDQFICLLKTRGGTIDELIAHFATNIDKTSIYYIAQQLALSGLLCFSLVDVDAYPDAIITLEPMTTCLRLDTPESQWMKQEIVLSRFIYIRNKDKTLILETPLGHAVIYLHDPSALRLIHLLLTPRSFDQLEKSAAFFTKDKLLALLHLLKIAKAITTTDDTGIADEVANKHLTQWDFHDLLFHTRTRMGRHHYPLGKTFRFKGITQPSRPLKSVGSGKIVKLPLPTNKHCIQDDPLQVVLEKRRSIRNYSEKSITLEQLSEFLYRSARVQQQQAVDDKAPYPTSKRSYPNAGASYELELYICLQRCETVTPGLYHYHPREHILELISSDHAAMNTLYANANRAIGNTNVLDVLFIITARFGRVNWQYESIAYALILKNVGILYQTFYLVATAMGLASCALGSGDSELFSKMTGLDYYEESSVGEFLLGIEQR